MYICSMISIPLFISTPEVFFILVVVVLVFGSDKLPEIARGLAKGMKTIRNATDDIKGEITRSVEKQGIDLDITKDLEKETKAIEKEINEIKGTVQRGKL